MNMNYDNAFEIKANIGNSGFGQISSPGDLQE